MNQIPKGKLIAIGGSEDKGTLDVAAAPKSYLNFFEHGILRRMMNEMKGLDSHVEIITTASIIPEEIGECYMDAFGKLHCPNIGIMHIKKKEDALNKKFLDRIKKADGVMFTGGNQMRLSSIFNGTEFLDILKTRYLNESFVIAGTSAGAMAMSGIMIYYGDITGALLKGEIKTTRGLELINNVIIDSHFVARGRFGRLIEAVTANKDCIGIGLGEDTGVLITEGDKMETIGSGLVIIFDGHDLSYTNIQSIEDGMPLSIENMVLHVLAKGDKYSISKRKFFPAEKALNKV